MAASRTIGPGGASGSINFPLVLTSQDPIFKNPESWQWNAAVQREFFGGTTVEAAYVGRRALHQQRERNINAVPLGTVQANPGVNVDYLRPFKGYSTIRVTNNDANALYNALQFNLTKRYSKGLIYGIAYTYSKAMDDGSAQRDIIPNPFDRSMLWGPASLRSAPVFVGNIIYELPFFRNSGGVTRSILGGWQLTLLMQAQTGNPFTIGTGDDIAGFGPGNGNNDMPSTIYNVGRRPAPGQRGLLTGRQRRGPEPLFQQRTRSRSRPSGRSQRSATATSFTAPGSRTGRVRCSSPSM